MLRFYGTAAVVLVDGTDEEWYLPTCVCVCVCAAGGGRTGVVPACVRELFKLGTDPLGIP